MQLLLFLIIGYLLAVVLGLRHLEEMEWYSLLTGILLTIGLYSSTYGIVLEEARKHARIILSAITIGVIVKALFIGIILAWVLHDPFYLILGVLMAQIDPLSVSTLMHGSRLSAKAKTILASWSSFDDPITVIMALYVPLIAGKLLGIDWQPVTDTALHDGGLIGYFSELGINIAYAAGVFVLWLLIKQFGKKAYKKTITIASVILYGFLGMSLSIATYYFWMLSVALIGLFLRPPIEHIIQQIVKWALRFAAVLLGILLVGGIEILSGLYLAIAAFTAQIFVGFLLTHGLSLKDRLHIAFAQQNGITAIILALLFEPAYPNTVAIIAPAILFVNLIHWGANKLLDSYILNKKN